MGGVTATGPRSCIRSLFAIGPNGPIGRAVGAVVPLGARRAVRAWVARILRPIRNGGRRASVILDPDKLLNEEDFDGGQAPRWISSWYELRRWWENSVQGGRAD